MEKRRGTTPLRQQGVTVLLAIPLGILLCVSLLYPQEPPPSPARVAASGFLEVAFSPRGGATQALVAAIQETKERLLVQAFSFTSAPIARALVEAHRRGVNVRVILDAGQTRGKIRYNPAVFLSHMGIPVRLDAAHAMAHNKVMVMDGKTVVTGSFNFTKAAEERNAENLLILWDNPALARLYEENWQYHWAHSEEFRPAEQRTFPFERLPELPAEEPMGLP
jgi:phosphatidylserine/phosphatidylglycerophosphate/cardiolipin synthase-like enzyme